MRLGIIFALIALLAWALDDFFIARNTRRFGDWRTMAALSSIGLLLLTPFIWNTLTSVIFWSNPAVLIFLLVTGIVTFFAAFTDFEALRLGKLAVIDPVYALEIPTTLIITSIVIREHLNTNQIGLVLLTFIGILFITSKGRLELKKLFTEKGVRLAILAALLMGATNFLTGLGARLTNPFIINWFVYLTLAMISWAVVLNSNKTFKKINTHGQKELVTMGLADTIAWTAFAFSATLIPIAITTAISEGYIAVAAVLGVVVNKEKINKLQFFGIFIVVLAVVLLSLSEI